jgi:2-keto-4-pentenoate hydratase/2-oxohepta-3-ene-1,7-dioic acid hydratase in catechol pathway
VKIKKVGKNIPVKFASDYFDEITLGIDFTARDIQEECKKKGLPWEKAKGFDNSAPLGFKFISKNELDFPNVNFFLHKNGTIVQHGKTSDMIFSIETIISYVSQFITLKTGDLIFTGTPAGVGPTVIGDHFEGFIGSEKILDLKIK